MNRKEIVAALTTSIASGAKNGKELLLNLQRDKEGSNLLACNLLAVLQELTIRDLFDLAIQIAELPD